MDLGHESEVPKGLVARLVSIEKKLDEALEGWRQLAARLRGPPKATSKTPTTPSAAGPSLAGVPAADFKATPHFDVGHGVLRDGRGGPVMARNVLRGAERLDVADLVTRGRLRVADAIANQATDDSGTMIGRKRNAESTLSTIKKVIGDIASIEKEDGCHGWAWTLKRNEAIRVEFSIDRAVQLAEQAQGELDANRPDDALATVDKAREEDDCVQLVHEVACRIALVISSTLTVDEVRIRKSMRFLEARITRLKRVRLKIVRSLPDFDDEELRATHETIEREFSDEQRRLESLLEQMVIKFGDPHRNDLPNDRAANDAIKLFRGEKLSVEQVCRHSMAEAVLGHPCITSLRTRWKRRARDETEFDEHEVRQTVNDVVLTKVCDLRIPARIRLVCAHAEAEIRKTLLPSAENCPEGRDARTLNKAKDAFRAKHERYPDWEELAQMLDWTVERVQRTEKWEKTHRPERLDLDEWRRKRKADPDDDSDDDDPGGMLAITGE